MPPVSPCGYAVDVIRTAKRIPMRFWRESVNTVPVQWYFVPPDRPFLPLADGWIFWDSERDPANEGIRRATGELVQGEDYLTDPAWAAGLDPELTVWREGVYCGTPDEWQGKGESMRVPPAQLVPPRPPLLEDCCLHGSICGSRFVYGGPRVIRAPSFFAAAVPAGPFTPGPLHPPSPPLGFAGTFGFCFWNNGVGQRVWGFNASGPFKQPRPQKGYYVTYEMSFFFASGEGIVYRVNVPYPYGWLWREKPLVLPLVGDTSHRWYLPSTISVEGAEL